MIIATNKKLLKKGHYYREYDLIIVRDIEDKEVLYHEMGHRDLCLRHPELGMRELNIHESYAQLYAYTKMGVENPMIKVLEWRCKGKYKLDSMVADKVWEEIEKANEYMEKGDPSS